jgi:hypothetical protein
MPGLCRAPNNISVKHTANEAGKRNAADGLEDKNLGHIFRHFINPFL